MNTRSFHCPRTRNWRSWIRVKPRFVFLVLVLFIFLVSYKILEPEISGRNRKDGLDGTELLWERAAQNSSEQVDSLLRRDAVIRNLIDKYKLNMKHHLSESPWIKAAGWVNSREVHPENTPEMGSILREMNTRKILTADTGHKGTQLKLSLTLQGGQRVAFKPKQFLRDDIITGKPYSGADRHNGEIASFHLGRILEFRRTPLVVGRKINLNMEVVPVATDRLLKTFFTKGNNTCFYGKCLYCKGPADGVCADGVMLEGTIVLWLPPTFRLKNHRHPWGRTYVDNKSAQWETDNNFCKLVRENSKYSTGPRLMDIVDTAMLDYLIGNADRHHYESFENDSHSMLLIMDNAKSFGNPYLDERTILAPLYQCCSVRYTTWQRLLLFQNGVLSRVLKALLDQDPVAPVLAEAHLLAMDRRLKHILLEIETCIVKSSLDEVLIKGR